MLSVNREEGDQVQTREEDEGRNKRSPQQTGHKTDLNKVHKAPTRTADTNQGGYSRRWWVMTGSGDGQ